MNMHRNARAVPLDAPTAPGMARLDGRITPVEFVGASLRYAVAIGSGEVLVDVPHESGNPPLPPGTPIAVGPHHSRALFLAA